MIIKVDNFLLKMSVINSGERDSNSYSSSLASRWRKHSTTQNTFANARLKDKESAKSRKTTDFGGVGVACLLLI